MSIGALRKLHLARPFKPFRLRLANGRKLGVMRPEMIAYSPKSLFAVVYFTSGSFEIVDLLLVTGLEVMSNGRRGKRR